MHEKQVPPPAGRSRADRKSSDVMQPQDHHHHHHHHNQFPLIAATSLFPASSIRDILSLIFILLSLPQSVSLCLLTLYITLGTNFMGGKFIVNFLLREHAEPVQVNYRRLGWNLIKILAINSAAFCGLSMVVRKKSYFNYLVILSKSIVSSDLIGSSSINYINTISNKRITTKIQYDDNKKFFNNNIINSFVCFVIINYIHYLINWLNLSFKFVSVYSTSIGYVNNYTFNHISTKLYLILSLHVINSTLFKKSTILQSSIPNVTEDISINCDSNKLLEVDLKDSISNSSPIDFYGNTAVETNSVAIKNFENFIISPFNSKLTILKNKLRTNANPNISNNINKAISQSLNEIVAAPASSSGSSAHTVSSNIAEPSATTTSTTTTSSSSSTSTSLTTTTVSPNVTTIENTIIIQPFWSILAASKAILKNPNLFSGTATMRKNNGGEFINLYESSRSIKSNKVYNKNLGSVRMALILNDDSKIVLKFIDSVDKRIDLNNLKVRLNNVGWSFFKIVKDENINDEEKDSLYLVIYSLTSLFQYEIDVIVGNSILNHFIVNTTQDDDKVVLSTSLPETSSLATLQISLLSTMKNLNNLRLKFRKFKKDENRKLTEFKNNIDNLKNKISKYNSKQSSDSRVFGKLKGLKHSVIQLENEIQQLHIDIEELTVQEKTVKKELTADEAQLLDQYKDLERVMAQYEDRLKVEKLKLKSTKSDKSAVSTKHQKLVNKQLSKQEEIKALQNELKNIKKNEILSKFSRRIKKTNEKFETILPKVLQEIEVLRRECNSLLNN